MTFCDQTAAFNQFNILMNEMFAFGKLYEKKYGVVTLAHLDSEDYNRYGADCRYDAGAVPCHLINFFDIASTKDLYQRVNALFDYVFAHCTPTYSAKWEAWLARYHRPGI